MELMFTLEGIWHIFWFGLLLFSSYKLLKTKYIKWFIFIIVLFILAIVSPIKTKHKNNTGITTQYYSIIEKIER